MFLKALTYIQHNGKTYVPEEQFEAARPCAERLFALRAAVVLDDLCSEKTLPVDTESVEDAPITQNEEHPEDEMNRRIAMEEEYRSLGGRPQPNWSLEKLQAKLEERRDE